MESFDQLKQKALEAISYFDAKEAKQASGDLEFELKKISGMPNRNYEEEGELLRLFIRLKLLALPLLKDEEIPRLFRAHLVSMASDPELDLSERVETRQLTCPELLRMEMVNEPIIETIHENEEQIGQNKIFIQGNNEAVVPTVKNWLLDYDRTYGTRPQKDLVWLDYAANNRNARSLAAEEKSTLRRILKFYEFLKTVKKQEE